MVLSAPRRAGSKQNDRPGDAVRNVGVGDGAGRRGGGSDGSSAVAGRAGVQKKSNLKPMEDVYTMCACVHEYVCARLCVCVCVCTEGPGNIEKRPFHKMAAHSLH